MQRDPNMCFKCKYHGYLTGVDIPKEGEPIDARIKRNIFCNYAHVSGKGSALKRKGSDIVDTRGKNPKKCKLYSEGTKLHRHAMNNTIQEDVK